MAKRPVSPDRSGVHDSDKRRPASGPGKAAPAPKLSSLKRSTDVISHRKGGDTSTKSDGARPPND